MALGVAARHAREDGLVGRFRAHARAAHGVQPAHVRAPTVQRCQ